MIHITEERLDVVRFIGPASKTQVLQMIEQMQNHLTGMNLNLQYSFYGVYGEKVAVIIASGETGEVIREILSKELQALQTKMGELVGMIFTDNA